MCINNCPAKWTISSIWGLHSFSTGIERIYSGWIQKRKKPTKQIYLSFKLLIISPGSLSYVVILNYVSLRPNQRAFFTILGMLQEISENSLGLAWLSWTRYRMILCSSSCRINTLLSPQSTQRSDLCNRCSTVEPCTMIWLTLPVAVLRPLSLCFTQHSREHST